MFSTLFITLSLLLTIPLVTIGHQPRWSLKYKTALVGKSAFSPDSSKVATANRTGKIQIRDAESGRLLKTSRQQNKTGYDNPIDWSPNGKYLLTPGILWNARSLKIVKRYGGDGEACAFSSDGSQFAAYVSPRSGGQLRRLNIYETATKKLLKTLYSTNDSAAYYPSKLQFTRDDLYLLVGLQNKARGVHVWDLKTNQRVKSLRTSSDVTDLHLSPNQKVLALGLLNTSKGSRGGRGSIQLYHYPSLRKIHKFRGIKGHVTSIDFHPSSEYLVSTQYHSKPTFHLWDLKKKRLLVRSDKIKRHTNFAQFSPDGRSLAIVSHTFGDMGNPTNFDMYDVGTLAQIKRSGAANDLNTFRRGQKVRVKYEQHWYTGSVNRKGKQSYLIEMDGRKPKYWLWVKPSALRPVKRGR